MILKVSSELQVAHSGNAHFTPRFALLSVYPEYESLLCLWNMFLDLSMEKVLAIH